MPNVIADFEEFVMAATAIVGGDVQPGLAAFERFAATAVPLVIADIKQRLPELAARATAAERWLCDDDLLATAGCSYAENAYTELMAWALRPESHPPSAADRQRAWLDLLGVGRWVDEHRPAEPATQVPTADGVPDLVLQYGPHVICCECKTGSAEHAAPSGAPQTVAYVPAIRNALRLPDHGRVQMVFVTLDGHKAANPEAVRTTYVQFALAIIRGLDGHVVAPPTWAAYAVLFTHLLGSAVPHGTDDLQAVIRRVAAASPDGRWQTDRDVFDRRADLVLATATLIPEQIQ